MYLANNTGCNPFHKRQSKQEIAMPIVPPDDEQSENVRVNLIQNSISNNAAAIKTNRTTAEIAADLEAKHQEKAKRKEKLKTKRKRFNASRKDLMLTMLKSGISYECAACGERNNIHVDHITPLSKGGGNGVENLQFLCGPCNSKKGTKLTTAEFDEGEQVALF